MTSVDIAFKIAEGDQHTSVGFKQVTGHLVWDIKMDFAKKSRWVLYEHKTPNPIGSTYTGVVSRESVRIELIYAALNGLDVCDTDIRKAYLQDLSSHTYFIICEPEFGLENV